MAKQKYFLRGKRLSFFDEYEDRETVLIDDISAEPAAWLSWLQSHKSFRFEVADRSCSVRKETRPWFDSEDVTIDVWYSYKMMHRRRKRKYLGKSEVVSYQKLLKSLKDLYKKLSTI